MKTIFEKDNKVQYRTLPHGDEQISTIGIGLGNIHTAGYEQVVKILNYAIDNGINFFDLCCGDISDYAAFAEASYGRRDKVYTQIHFGAVYDTGAYGFSRDLDLIKSTIDNVLTAAKTDYSDFGYIHCIDEQDDFDDIMSNGLFDYLCALHKQGVIRHIGFSSHTPSIANKMLDTGLIDSFMFSINPAYDYSKGEFAAGEVNERTALYTRAAQMGVGITVMKPFAGGQLLDVATSPINLQLSRYQCIKYVLDRPAVLCCVPGVASVENVKEILNFYSASAEELDYSILGKATPPSAQGRCVYCNHCAPCPADINIGLVNKYYDLAKVGDKMAASHYEKLSSHAEDCIQCGHCESRCPFGVLQPLRMKEIKEYFGK